MLAFWYQNSSKLIYIRTLNTLVLNPFLLKFQILLFPPISSVFIALQDTQPISLKDLLENLATIHSEFFIFGDFNLHLDIPSAIKTTFNDILDPHLRSANISPHRALRMFTQISG